MADKMRKASNILAARYHNVWETLSRDQVEKIHEASLHILEHTGTKIIASYTKEGGN